MQETTKILMSELGLTEKTHEEIMIADKYYIMKKPTVLEIMEIEDESYVFNDKGDYTPDLYNIINSMSRKLVLNINLDKICGIEKEMVLDVKDFSITLKNFSTKGFCEIYNKNQKALANGKHNRAEMLKTILSYSDKKIEDIPNTNVGKAIINAFWEKVNVVPILQLYNKFREHLDTEEEGVDEE